MALKSTGLSSHIAVTGSIKAALDGGLIYIFSGPVPASADDAPDASCVLLSTISVDGAGTGLTFESAATDGALVKTAAETWKGTNAATGTAAFYRFCASGDDGSTDSTTAARIQGTAGGSGLDDLVLPSADLTSGNTQTIDVYQVY